MVVSVHPGNFLDGVPEMDILSAVAATQLSIYWYGDGGQHEPRPVRPRGNLLPLIGMLGLGAIALMDAAVQAWFGAGA